MKRKGERDTVIYGKVSLRGLIPEENCSLLVSTRFATEGRRNGGNKGYKRELLIYNLSKRVVGLNRSVKINILLCRKELTGSGFVSKR